MTDSLQRGPHRGRTSVFQPARTFEWSGTKECQTIRRPLDDSRFSSAEIRSLAKKRQYWSVKIDDGQLASWKTKYFGSGQTLHLIRLIGGKRFLDQSQSVKQQTKAIQDAFRHSLEISL